MLRFSSKTRFLQSAAILVATASGAAAASPTPNITAANVNVLDLLSPFLSLNGTSVGRTTLTDNIEHAIAVNNYAATFSPSLQQLSYSDKNLLNAASNTVTGLPDGSYPQQYYGVAANLAGGLPPQPAPAGGIPGLQQVGGLGSALGAIYDQGVNAYANGNPSVLPNTVNLLTQAYNFTSSDLGVAKNYFANGNKSNPSSPPYVGVPAIPPAGHPLPTYTLATGGSYPNEVLPNTTDSVYDLAYGVKNTDPNQNVYGSSRPVQVTSINTTWGVIDQFDPTSISGLTTNPSFPSGHTNYAYTDSILIGMMVPQLYQNMLVRASQFANSRIVLGVHYPLDIIASRSFAQYDLAQAFTNSTYINNGGAMGTGTAINLPGLFNAATPELNAFLTTNCGGTIASCAAAQQNPYAPSAQNAYYPTETNAQFYANNLTYGLPTLSYAKAPQEQAPAGGPDASILLAPIFGGSTTAALAIEPSGGIDGNLATSTIDQIIVNTEGQALAAFYGTSLSYWSRLNLEAAIGYFGDVTGTLTLAPTDNVKTNVTIGSTGVIRGTGKITGAVTNLGAVKPGDAPGVLTIEGDYQQVAPASLDIELGGTVPGTQYSQLIVDGSATLAGALDLSLVNGFTLTSGDAFDIVGAGDGLTNGMTALSLGGEHCAAEGGQTYKCWAGSFFDIFTEVTVPGTLVPSGADPVDLMLETNVIATPEPSTWAMLLTGFAGLGYAGFRQARRGTLAAKA